MNQLAQENQKLREALKEIHALILGGGSAAHVTMQILAIVRMVLR